MHLYFKTQHSAGPLKKILFLCIAVCSVSASADCGKAGPVQERILDCQLSRSSGPYQWRLVTETNGHQSWMDASTGTIWSDIDFAFSEPNLENYQLAVSVCANAVPGGLLPSIADFDLADSHGLLEIVAGFGRHDDSGEPEWYWTVDQCSSPFPGGCLMGVYWKELRLHSRSIFQTGRLATVRCISK